MEKVEKEKILKIIYGVSGFIYGTGRGFLYGFIVFMLCVTLSFPIEKKIPFQPFIKIGLLIICFVIFPIIWGYLGCIKGIKFYIEHQKGGGSFIGGASGLFISYILVTILIFSAFKNEYSFHGPEGIFIFALIFGLVYLGKFIGFIVEWFINLIRKKSDLDLRNNPNV